MDLLNIDLGMQCHSTVVAVHPYWDTWHFSCTLSLCAGGSLSSAPRCVPLDSLCERLCNLAQAEELNCDSITDPQQVRFAIV